jgi:hypothetical protein
MAGARHPSRRVDVVTAQPDHGGPGPNDPAEILRILPPEHHANFLAEYTAAVESARRPEEYRTLAALLRLWRLRATAYAEPEYADRLAAARAGDTSGDVPAERLIAGWPPA